MSDPISDMLTCVRNAQAVGKNEVKMPSSKLKIAICKVLKGEGYITEYEVTNVDSKPTLIITLKYYLGRPVISEIKRLSRPGLRVYKGKHDLPKLQNGLGTVILSTSKGVMTDRAARTMGQGGEILCYVF